MTYHKVILGSLLFILSTPLAFSQEEPFAARITFGYNDAEQTRWTGRVTADNARVAAIEGWHFLADDRISLNTFDIQTGTELSKGITVRGTVSPGARISVETSQGTLSFLISDVRLGEEVAFLEGAARVERLPDAVKLTDDFRDDDYPSIAVVDDSTAWVVWQSYSGQFDEVRISKYDGSWRTITRLPGVSGDVWRPQVALDAEKRPWVVWSQQVDGNFDIYARALDEESNTWLKVVRLSSHPYSDIDHHLVSDHKGDLWVVWQGFHGDNSDIFLRQYNGSQWSEEVRVTDHPANDWEPRVAVDDQGKAYIVWDTYRNGNYDVYMRAYENGNLAPEEPVAMTPKFEAHASVAVDGAGRVWVAWDESGPNWAKDTGATIDPQWRGKSQDERRRHWAGVRIYESRNLNLVVLEGSGRKMPVQDVQLAVSKEGFSHDFPQLLVDRRSNRIGLLFHRRGRSRRALRSGRGRAYWETAVTFYQGDTWQPVLAMPNSWGRSSMRPAAAYAPDGSLWVTWPTDGRLYINTHQPVVGNVYAAHLLLEEISQAPVLKPWEETEEIEVSPAHGNEVADLTAIRRYRTFVHGVEKRIVRGDFHRHTELSWDGGGQVDGSLPDFYRYMIDAAAMDFGAVTDHFAGGGYEYWWWITEKSCDMYHIPRVFTTFYGYERSARFPNGHRNVFHTTRGIPVVSFFTEAGFDGPLPGVSAGELMENDTKLLYESLHRTGGIAISHTSTSRGMGTDWRDNDPEVEPVVEIFQGLRVSNEHLGAPRAARGPEDRPPGGFQEAGFLWNAYRKGYRLGTITSSDHSSTHISYAMVYTEQPTREAIFEAIQKRHTYGATDNIIMDYRMGEHFMGEEFTAPKVPPLKVRIMGTSQVAKVEIIKNEKIIYSTAPDKRDVTLTFVDQDIAPGTSYYYVRVIQDDRQIAWSSPIWVTYQP